ncbi:MAG: inositol monophosphatase family protein [Phycisphaerales bacterium]
MTRDDWSTRRQAAAFAAVRRAVLATQAARALIDRAASETIAKDDASPVTIADFASQAIVVRMLAHLLGAAPILGEESDTALRDEAHRAILDAVVAAADAAEEGIDAEEILEALATPKADPRNGPCWALDPVDGTKGFLRGGQYAIALAWIAGENGRGTPAESVIASPALDPTAADPATPSSPGVIAVAAPRSGARIASLAGGESAALVAHDWKRGDPIRLALSFERAHGDADSAVTLARRIGETFEPFRLDSCSKYLLVANGRADAYLRIPRDATRAECVWDHAAGVRIAMESGCTVCDLRGEPLDFGRGPTLSANVGIVVAPPRLAEALVAAARA